MLHVLENKSMEEIGRELGCSSDTIRYNLDKHKIPITRHKQKEGIDGVDLYELYVLKKMSIHEIVHKYNTSHTTVKKRLIEIGIEPRDLSDAQFAWKKINPHPLLFDKDWLESAYIDERMSLKEIGAMLEHTPSTIKRHLLSCGIDVRSEGESRIGVLSGDKHPNWKGGICGLSKLCREYFSTNITPKILKRDKYTCQYCKKKKKDLHVHHIYHFADIMKDIISENPNLDVDSDKDILYKIIVSDHRFNNEDNLITYCKDCHCFKIHKYTKRQSSAKPKVREGSTTIESTDISGSE